ncbi:hypothetical protein ITY58_000903 [Campylobacter lari]|nr:hypothetical protein [Campylobacter lari]
MHTISKSINAFDNFKFSLDQNKQLICYDIIHPSYTIFHKDSKTFSVLWTFYKENLNDFLSLHEEDKQLSKSNKSMFLKELIDNLFIFLLFLGWLLKIFLYTCQKKSNISFLL